MTLPPREPAPIVLSITEPARDSLFATQRDIHLPTGVLRIDVTRADRPLDTLCGFAARRNPKRGFLFVSRVLGRHLPSTPASMREVNRLLAAKLARLDLPGPIIVLGLAETAIGLGHGVFEEFLSVAGRDDVLFLHSTRYRLASPVAFRFHEEHSHAAAHTVYRPVGRENEALFSSARSLVVVDDEASTGRTVANLARASHAVVPGLTHLATAVITDWRGPRPLALNDPGPLATHAVSLLEGRYEFEPNAAAHGLTAPSAIGSDGSKDALLHRNDGRLGLRHGTRAPMDFARGLAIRPGERVLVLGTGEFVHPPFRLAEALEADGARAFFQATSRSPALVGDAIACALTFPDNYEDGIPNYLYNARREDYDHVVCCFETPASTVQPELVEALGARALLL